MDVRVGLWRKLSAEELMLLNCGVGEDSWESLGLQGDPTSPSLRRSALRVHWKDWCWSWNSSALATSCEELTHWKRPWCWEGLGAGGEGGDRGWDGWMASPAGWHHRLDEREFEWIPGVANGQGGLACCYSWGCKESDTTEQLNWTEAKNWEYLLKVNTVLIVRLNTFSKLRVSNKLQSTYFSLKLFTLGSVIKLKIYVY